ANLSGADLSRANLSDANLWNANLWNANLSGASGVLAPVVENIDAAILEQVAGVGKLDMTQWHQCDSTHCRAGWAIHLAGDAGYALEDKIGSSAAGALIYHASAGYIPDFYASNEDALADMREH